ncbi:excinuclease ABC subunit UvrA [Lignipirellula cremea]|uniref:UvrABC system protein A n=1 Tax=Lignipirellula cremea TaxID=2528010 RepID=A0A518DQT8_9BACT|nr:excinuclease ABC subunit UvrA [Lignipirellula cremea]QDU94203.1 UvrABC system protein A [Lignipirellula cremea]
MHNDALDPLPTADSAYALPPEETIRIRGARTHNLKNVDLDIPRDQFVVITGPSGSGKSSLAFDTVFAEGRRQYFETLSVYSRQFLDQLERPDVDLIEGLQPTVCIDQRPANANPRSTVGTVTEIYDYLRLLLARLGLPHCYQCGEPILQQSSEQIQESLLGFPEGVKVILLAPLARGRKGKHEETLAQVRRNGFVRVRIDREVFDIDHAPELDPRHAHDIEAVVDRVVIRSGSDSRIAESVDLALKHGEGVMLASWLDTSAADEEHPRGLWRDRVYSTLYACARCGISYTELEPRTFSFNSPYGACTVCDGLGVKVQFDPELVFPDGSLTLKKGGIAPWRGLTKVNLKKRLAELKPFFKLQNATAAATYDKLSPAAQQSLWQGEQKFVGLQQLLEKEWSTTTDDVRLGQLELFRGETLCPACGGGRLRPEALHVRLAEKNIQEICGLSLAAADDYFASLEFDPSAAPVGEPLVAEIRQRLSFLQKAGVDYLTLDRSADTLSGGELQRVRLGTCIGAGLVGVCYVLDEPSIGLHPRDNERLIAALRDLQRRGNSVLVVEHDEAMMRASDRLIDFGPGAGTAGGQVVSQGTVAEVILDPQSLTGRYLSGAMQIAVPDQRRRTAKANSIVIEGAQTNNLQDVTARFPLGAMVCVTGVSGSGKSSLVNDTLAPALIRKLGGAAVRPGPFRSLRGASKIDKVVRIDQSPIGRSPRSNAATYVGAFDPIRKLFAAAKESKRRGFRASRFSFNVKSGRCEECQGQGLLKIEMNFLPDLYVPCPRCKGARFNRQTLEVKHRGKSIAEVLEMRVDEAVEFFENVVDIHRPLASLQDVGLGYLPLGQPSTTLSGGEAQRVKLAAELSRVDTGATLYLLDEPTTGLHFEDIRRLLDVFQRLVDKGNTMIVIEHNMEVIKTADWVLDLGPDGGAGGGCLLAEGTPEEVAANANSHTGRFLRPLLSMPGEAEG